MREITAETFLKDVQQHCMTVIRAEGTHRHLRFKRPGSSTYWFDIITWPGSLCINGDCGTYVFSRLEDMFQFFGGDTGRINPSYWSEKCDAQCRTDGIKQWDGRQFKSEVVRRFRDHCHDYGVAHDLRRECFSCLRDELLYASENEHEAREAADSFCHEFPDGTTFRLTDFWEVRCEEFTVRYLWCLHAIVWAIQQFESAQQGRAAA